MKCFLPIKMGNFDIIGFLRCWMVFYLTYPLLMLVPHIETKVQLCELGWFVYSVCGTMTDRSSVLRQKGKFQIGCFKKTNQPKFSGKRTSLTLKYAHVCCLITNEIISSY